MACHSTCCSRDLSAGCSVTWTGHAAASPSAQMVWPSICFVTSHNMSISSIRASPFFMRVMMSYSQGAPSLQQAKHSLRQAGGVAPLSAVVHLVHPDPETSGYGLNFASEVWVPAQCFASCSQENLHALSIELCDPNTL